jgi:hypothetical protein
MRIQIIVASLVLGLFFAIPQPVRAANTIPHPIPPFCYYSPFPIWIDDCIGFGRQATTPKTVPDQPNFQSILPSKEPDPSLSDLPYWYARVTRKNAPLFTSLEAAVAGKPVYRTMETGFDYVTYIDLVRVDGKRYFMISPGIWLPGNGVSPVATPTFQSLEFTETPENDFGWVLFEVESQATPGYGHSEFTGNLYTRYNIVQIFDTQEIEGIEWYLIGPDEWVEERKIARVTPDITKPDGATGNRWIEVNLKEQTLSVYNENQLVFAALVSTGVPGAWTQPGLFQIYLQKETETMSGAFTADRSDYYYLEDVPWTMYFDQARALHGTYWHNGFGVPTSRGCVNLSPGDAQWIFNWAEEGDWVYVWDPSGNTPTDPALYHAGGA